MNNKVNNEEEYKYVWVIGFVSGKNSTCRTTIASLDTLIRDMSITGKTSLDSIVLNVIPYPDVKIDHLGLPEHNKITSMDIILDKVESVYYLGEYKEIEEK